MTLIKKMKDKKVNFEFNKEYIKVLTDKIASNDALFITNSFKEMHPADAADIIEHLGQNDRENLIKLNNFKIDPPIPPVAPVIKTFFIIKYYPISQNHLLLILILLLFLLTFFLLNSSVHSQAQFQ